MKSDNLITTETLDKAIKALEARLLKLISGVDGGTRGGMTQLTGPVTAGPGSGSQITAITATGVTPGAYGDSTHVAQVTVGADGRITNITLASISSSYTDEQAQDAVGNALVDSTTIDFTYDDALNTITAIVKDASITYAKMQSTATAKRVLGAATAGVVGEIDLSTLLDWIGSAAQGDILFRDASTWARLAAGTAGQALVTGGAGANPAWNSVGSGAGGALTLISEVITAGSQATVTFSSIVSTYRDLFLIVRGRGTASAGSVSVRVRFNGDTGLHYHFEEENRFATAGVDNLSNTSLSIGAIPAATALANSGGYAEALIANYKGTTFHKTVGARAHMLQAVAVNGIFEDRNTNYWGDTSAITTVDVFLSSGNFVNDSVVSLYGRS